MVRVRGKVGRGAFRHDFGPEQMFSFAAAVFWCRPKDLYVLDEVTTDLDVIARDRLLELMHRESQRGATVLYATHIFDNLDGWATHILRLHQGMVTWCSSLEECTPYVNYRKQCLENHTFNPLYKTVRDWVLEDWYAREQEQARTPTPGTY